MSCDNPALTSALPAEDAGLTHPFPHFLVPPLHFFPSRRNSVLSYQEHALSTLFDSIGSLTWWLNVGFVAISVMLEIYKIGTFLSNGEFAVPAGPEIQEKLPFLHWRKCPDQGFQ